MMQNCYPGMMTAQQAPIPNVNPAQLQQVQQLPPSLYYQQLQQQSVMPTVIASIVNKPEDIRPNNVPMDGIAVFPLADESAVIIKRWNSMGTIDTIVYDRHVEEPAVEEKVDLEGFMTSLTEKIQNLEDLIKSTKTTTSKVQNGGKKEVAE